jgi:hypothetical protein
MSPIQDTDLARAYQEERQSEAANQRLAAQVVREPRRKRRSTEPRRVTAQDLRAWIMRIFHPATAPQKPS